MAHKLQNDQTERHFQERAVDGIKLKGDDVRRGGVGGDQEGNKKVLRRQMVIMILMMMIEGSLLKTSPLTSSGSLMDNGRGCGDERDT